MADFDIVLYGATGFTGRLAAHYMAEHAPDGLRWAVAGRNAARVRAIAEETGAHAALVADSTDASSIAKMVGQTRVLLTTAGPFAKYGTPVVQACAEAGVHYVDITGETPWVKELIDRFHDGAAQSRTKIVPFCGFDSVPADIGTLWMVEQFRDRSLVPRRLSASYKIKGGFNGGTLDSAITGAETGQSRTMADWFLLNPKGYRGGEDARENRDLRSVVWDEPRAAWLTPFVMAQINTRVVRRSNGLLAAYDAPYGPAFVYTEAMETAKRSKALMVAGGLGVAEKLLQVKLGRKLMQKLGPAPGEGPSEETMDGGFVRVRFLGESECGTRLLGTWSFSGDPGNRFTVMSLCESALLLAGDHEGLPGGPSRGGILTPATALGMPLLESLQRRGLEADVVEL